MQEDTFPAAERIINDIESAFKKDPKLEEFEIVPVTLNENKSPVIVHNHSLGLQSWCVTHVFYNTYNRLMDIRQQRWKREDPKHVSSLLTTCLLLNPNISTFWNMRREIVLSGHLDPHTELHYSAVVLSRKPKSSEVFLYRKWLIKNLLKDFPADPGLISSEFHICEMAADRYPNNYYTWNHRIWCLDQFPPDSQKSLNLFISEWNTSQKWMSTHVSDHSGLQYRQHLLLKLLTSCCKHTTVLKRSHPLFVINVENALQAFLQQTDKNYKVSTAVEKMSTSTDRLESDSITPECLIMGLICSDLILNTDIITTYVGHEALWYHRRFLLNTFHNHFIKNCKNIEDSHKNNDGVPFKKDLRMEDLSELMKNRLINYESSLLVQCTDDRQQYRAATKHKIWLENVLKIKVL